MKHDDRQRLRAALDAEYPPPHQSLAYRVLPPRIERRPLRLGGVAGLAAVLVAVVVAAAVFVAQHASVRPPTQPAGPGAVAPSPSPSPVPDPTVAATPALFAPAWFVSPQVGWMARDGSLAKTTDGGVHWAPQLTLSYPKLYARDMRFLDAQTGFVMPLDTTSGQGHPALYATTDGEHWSRRTVPPGITAASGMDFVSASEGYVLVDLGEVSAVFHTADGGRSWQLVATGAAGPAPGQLPNVAGAHLEGMRFLDPEHGWIAATQLSPGPADGNGLGSATPSFYATADGGRTWQEQPLPAPPGITYPVAGDSLEPPHFTDPLHGYAVLLATQPPGATPGLGKFGDQAALWYRTSDGGRTWSPAGISPGGALTGVALDQRDLLVLSTGDAYLSADGGATWRREAALPSPGSWADFPNPRDGFAGDPGSQALLVTHDGGRTWTTAG